MGTPFRHSSITKLGSINPTNYGDNGTFLTDATLTEHIEKTAIDLWLADFRLGDPEADLALTAHYWQILTESERHRASMMGIQRQREFILTRGVLRELLSNYVEIPPRYLPIATSPNGKPYLDCTDQICFSVTHGQNCALYGVMSNGQGNNRNPVAAVGIDLEFQHRDLSTSTINKLVRRYFLPQEQEIWLTHLQYLENSNVNADLIKFCFLQSWTAKEAYAKATGLGLAHTLNHPANHLDTSPWLTKILQRILEPPAAAHRQAHNDADLDVINLGIDLQDLQVIATDHSDNLSRIFHQETTYTVRNLGVLFSKLSKPECISAVCWRWVK